jgi:hypothetical protein
MYKTMISILIISLIYGCSQTKKINVPDGGITVIDYGADRRGSYLMKAKDNGYVIVSEPSPDVAQEITSSLGLSAETIGDLVKPELMAAYANKVVDLASRGQTLQVLRESLFRLSEMGASSDITTQQRVALYIKVLDTIRLIAATEFADSDASQEVKDATLKKFLADTETETVKIPENK